MHLRRERVEKLRASMQVMFRGSKYFQNEACSIQPLKYLVVPGVQLSIALRVQTQARL